MNIDLESLSREQIADRTKKYLINELQERFPDLVGEVSMIIVGSIALDVYDRFSDVDVNILLSEKVDNLELKKYKNELKESGSQIELRLARTYETLERYLNWNDDFILGEYQNAVVLHDPTKRFSNLIKKFEWYPDDIFVNKVNWLFHEITHTIFIDLESLLPDGKGNQYFVNVVKDRLVRYFLTAIRLMNKKFPIHDKKLYVNTKKLVGENSDIVRELDELLLSSDPENIYNAAKYVRKKMENELLTKSLLEKMNVGEWLNYTSKGDNKIIFE